MARYSEEGIRIGFYRNDDEENEIAHMAAHVVPRVGEEVGVFTAAAIDRKDAREKFCADALSHWKSVDGTQWIVRRVQWIVGIDYEGRSREPSVCVMVEEVRRG